MRNSESSSEVEAKTKKIKVYYGVLGQGAKILSLRTGITFSEVPTSDKWDEHRIIRKGQRKHFIARSNTPIKEGDLIVSMPSKIISCGGPPKCPDCTKREKEKKK